MRGCGAIGVLALALGLTLGGARAAPVVSPAEPAFLASGDSESVPASSGSDASPEPTPAPESATPPWETDLLESAPGLAPSLPVTPIERAWRSPAPGLDVRVSRTRRAALEHGAWTLDPAARTVLSGDVGGDTLERARAAVTLAPDLPSARVELARALWLHGDSPLAALRAAAGAVHVATRHPEASLWFASSALAMLAVALAGGALLLILLTGLAASPHAAHDLGHLVSASMPGYARLALLAAALLIPVALGEGLVGLVPGLLVIGIAYGTAMQRAALTLAVLGLLAGAHPVLRLALAALHGFSHDPVAEAAYSTTSGMALPVDLARLRAASEEDPLATRALAIHARRLGNLSEADALYQRLLEIAPTDLAVVNNAANVRLELGHMESALDLYGRAVELQESPVVLFNLSQAYGRAFQVDDLGRTLAQAQRVDGELVAQLTALQGARAEGFVVDLPPPQALLWKRVGDAARRQPLADELLGRFAPGHLGRGPLPMSLALGAGLVVGGLFAWRVEASRWCGRCGRRRCPRCDGEPVSGELCESCVRLFYQPEKTDRNLRLQRVNTLRERERRLRKLQTAVSVVVPAAAGLLVGRPLRALVGALLFSLAVAALVWREGLVPDPHVAGAAGILAFSVLASVCATGYAVVVAASLATLRKQ